MEEEKASLMNKQKIEAVFNNKRGLHEFLTVEMDFNLPGLDYVNIDWLRDIWQGKKPVSIPSSNLAPSPVLIGSQKCRCYPRELSPH